jgi:hypothetical protein
LSIWAEFFKRIGAGKLPSDQSIFLNLRHAKWCEDILLWKLFWIARWELVGSEQTRYMTEFRYSKSLEKKKKKKKKKKFRIL